MSDSNRSSITLTWIAFVSLVLLIVGWFVWGELKQSIPQAVSNEYETSRYADRAKSRIDRICVDLSGVDLLHCEYEIEQPQRDNHRAQKDLRAQRYMAIWAFFMTVFTFGTLIVTALGVFFVRQTLIQTNKTNEAAVSASNAANDANQIMRDEQRPWVFLDAEKGCAFEISDDWLYLEWFGALTNLGKLPAYSVTTETAIVCSHEEYLHPYERSRFAKSFVSKCQRKIRGGIVFAQEPPAVLKKRIKQKHDGSDGTFFLLHAVGYCLDGTSQEELGFEIKCFEIEMNFGRTTGVEGSHYLKEIAHLRMAT